MNNSQKGCRKMKEIDSFCTSEIVCPYCGHTFQDSWEYEDSDDECYCDECNKTFTYERYVQVTYTSYKND